MIKVAGGDAGHRSRSASTRHGPLRRRDSSATPRRRSTSGRRDRRRRRRASAAPAAPGDAVRRRAALDRARPRARPPTRSSPSTRRATGPTSAAAARAVRGARRRTSSTPTSTATSATRRRAASRSAASGDGALAGAGLGSGRTTGPGFIPFDALPTVLNPPERLHRHREPGRRRARLSRTCSPTTGTYGYRSQRITDLLRRRPGKVDADGHAGRSSSTTATASRRRSSRCSARSRVDACRARPRRGTCCSGWDFQQPAEPAPSAAAAFYNAFWRHLLVAHLRRRAAAREPRCPAAATAGSRWSAPLLDDPAYAVVGRRRPRRHVETRDDDPERRHGRRAWPSSPRRLGERPAAGAGATCTPWSCATRRSASPASGPIEWLFNRGPLAVGGRQDARQRDRLGRRARATRSTGCRRCGWSSTCQPGRLALGAASPAPPATPSAPTTTTSRRSGPVAIRRHGRSAPPRWRPRRTTS